MPSSEDTYIQYKVAHQRDAAAAIYVSLMQLAPVRRRRRACLALPPALSARTSRSACVCVCVCVCVCIYMYMYIYTYYIFIYIYIHTHVYMYMYM